MANHIYILGASGSGTTTLGGELSKRLGYTHFDSDDFLWVKTDPPFQMKMPIKKRQQNLMEKMKEHKQWILSGSLTSWGDVFTDCFDLVIYLWIPQDIRIDRLRQREFERYGDKIKENGVMYDTHKRFIDWAASYDTGDINTRSRMLHDEILKNMPCKVLRIEGLFEVEEKINKILEFIDAIHS